MESLNDCENLQQIKDNFIELLKKIHKELSIKNQELKSSWKITQQRNKEQKNKIDKLKNNILSASTSDINIIPEKVETRLGADVNNVKMKSEQLFKCKKSINTKVQEETKKMHKKFYEMITKDEVTLKPYGEVEEAISELANKTNLCIKKQIKDKEHFLKILNERKLHYTEIKQSIMILEPIEQEMRLQIHHCKKDFEEKLKLLKLKSVEEANKESNESKELLDDISNIKSQLNIQ